MDGDEDRFCKLLMLQWLLTCIFGYNTLVLGPESHLLAQIVKA